MPALFFLSAHSICQLTCKPGPAKLWMAHLPKQLRQNGKSCLNTALGFSLHQPYACANITISTSWHLKMQPSTFLEGLLQGISLWM